MTTTHKFTPQEEHLICNALNTQAHYFDELAKNTKRAVVHREHWARHAEELRALSNRIIETK